MSEKSKKRRSPQDNIHPIILHSITSSILSIMLLIVLIQANLALDLTIVLALFELICAGLFVGIGMTRNDREWNELIKFSSVARSRRGLPPFLPGIILLMTLCSSYFVLSFPSSQVDGRFAW